MCTSYTFTKSFNSSSLVIKYCNTYIQSTQYWGLHFGMLASYINTFFCFSKFCRMENLYIWLVAEQWNHYICRSLIAFLLCKWPSVCAPTLLLLGTNVRSITVIVARNTTKSSHPRYSRLISLWANCLCCTQFDPPPDIIRPPKFLISSQIWNLRITVQYSTLRNVNHFRDKPQSCQSSAPFEWSHRADELIQNNIKSIWLL